MGSVAAPSRLEAAAIRPAKKALKLQRILALQKLAYKDSSAIYLKWFFCYIQTISIAYEDSGAIDMGYLS